MPTQAARQNRPWSPWPDEGDVKLHLATRCGPGMSDDRRRQLPAPGAPHTRSTKLESTHSFHDAQKASSTIATGFKTAQPDPSIVGYLTGRPVDASRWGEVALANSVGFGAERGRSVAGGTRGR